MQLGLSLKSFYILVTEPKDSATSLLNLGLYKGSSVRRWWENEPQDITEQRSDMKGDNSSFEVRAGRKAYMPSEMNEKSDQSFYTAQEKSFLSQSEESVLRSQDILIDDNHLLWPERPQETLKDDKINTRSALLAEKKPTSPTAPQKDVAQYHSIDSWNQNLILIVEIIDITCGVCQRNDKKLITTVITFVLNCLIFVFRIR